LDSSDWIKAMCGHFEDRASGSGHETWEWDTLGAWAREAGRAGATWVSLVEGLLRTGTHFEPELDETLAEFGLTRPSFQVLVALLRADDQRLSQRALSRVVRRTSGTISTRLARLEKAGLVTREPDPDDQRGVIVTLTEDGRRRVESALPAYAAACERLGVALEDDDATDLAAKIGEWLGFFETPLGGEAGPELGIVVAPAHIAQRMRREVGLPDRVGVLVREVRTGSPAAAAGLERGDLLTAADGAEVRTIGDLQRAVTAAAEGGVLRLEVVRGVEERSVEVTLSPAA
jgi:DNA-binding MarR family transcriptional regulator